MNTVDVLCIPYENRTLKLVKIILRRGHLDKGE
jgi:hypothetical protein